jgi:DNA-binding MarR family transcriptional regulator
MKIEKFLSHSPIFACYLTNSMVVEAFQARLAKHEVHLLQGLVLTALFFEEREVRPSELSRAFQVDRSTLSHALRGLEKKGWLRRGLHPTDARGYVLTLTASGGRKALVLVKEFDSTQEGLEAALGSRRLREIVDEIHAIRRSYQNLFGSEG